MALTVRCVLCATAVCALAVVCAAQLKDLNEESFPVGDARVVNRWLDCVCSPTSRGFKVGTNLPPVPADAATAKRQYDACVVGASHEDCVNLDASRRPATGTANTYCSYMRDAAGPGRTVVSGSPGSVRTVAACDMDDVSDRNVPVDVPTGEDRVDKEDTPEVKNDGNKDGTGSGSGAVGGSPAPKQRNAHEGCVAVEHLAGYTMQHREHLVREVLCGRGFCATPNHALIVDGRWTSMRRLCASEWECVRAVKLVNNLKWRHNDRAVVGDIIVTPYDIRFPRAGVVAVQTLEDMLMLLVDSYKVVAVATGALLLVSRLA